jgi:CubicO group peptidase (beta-lactamase class C family)
MACLATALLAGERRSTAAQDRIADWNTWLTGDASGFSGVVLIGRDDLIDVAAAFGSADRTTGRPNTPDTRFNLGSINKTFTAIAVAQLVERNKLGLDDTLIKHLPDYPDKDAASRISIRQLLNHRSGVAQLMRPDFGDITVAAMTRIVGKEPLAFEPGTRQIYSNGGYVVLGRVIEVISGRSYAEYVTEHIHRPAGMTASGFFRSGDRTDNIALPVDSEGTGRATGPGNAAPQAAPRAGSPAGGGYSTAMDLVRFARALRSRRLLGPRMTQYVLDGTFAEDPKWGFALREQIAGSHRFIGNGGGAPGVNAEFRFEPAGAYTVVVLSNSSPPSATNLLKAILNRIAGGASAGGAASRTPAPSPQIQGTGLRAEVDTLHAEMLAAFRADHASVARFYTEDARILGGGRRYVGTDQVRAYFSQVPAGATWTLETRSEPQVYLPYQQQRDNSTLGYIPKDLIVKLDANRAGEEQMGMLAAAIRRIVANVDPHQPIADIQPLAAIVDGETAARATQVRVLGAFAALACLLAAVGLHGLLAFVVSARAREFGIRLALGAEPREILTLVARRGLLLGTAGVAVGVVVAYLAGRWLESLLVGVSPADAPALAIAISISIAMTVTGSLLPAIRAARTSPTEAMRPE